MPAVRVARPAPRTNMVDPEVPPDIPKDVSRIDLVAIVRVHDPDAFAANRDNGFPKQRVLGPPEGQQMRRKNLGCDIFLDLLQGQSEYTFGRPIAKRPSKPGEAAASSSDAILDVYLPSTRIAMKQFTLVPDRECNYWRMHSNSEILAVVNNVPLQVYNTRTKKKSNRLPHAIYLDQHHVNHLEVAGMHIDIWLIKPAQDAVDAGYQPPRLIRELQMVDKRGEEWAQDRYILPPNPVQVSSKTYEVFQRFLGETHRAKLFRDPQRGEADRDNEFSMFGGEKVHNSIVRYMFSVQVDGVPAAITTTRLGLVSYADVHDEIITSHPGHRFEIATAMFRPLFTALEFLHHHRIIHGSVNRDSVLLRIVDETVCEVFLVNYSSAFAVPLEEDMPQAAMFTDAHSAMEVIQDCCNIWELRKGPAPEAQREDLLRRQTEKAEKEHRKVQRICSEFFEKKSGDRQSETGRKLLQLLSNKEAEWKYSRNAQISNGALQEITMMNAQKSAGLIKQWNDAHERPKISMGHFMVVSLGHQWLDSLINLHFTNRWDLTPHDICSKLRALEGEDTDPWRSVPATISIQFKVAETGRDANEWAQMDIDHQSFASYLAFCFEIYMDWRPEIASEYASITDSTPDVVPRASISRMLENLQALGCVPAAMIDTLKRVAEGATLVRETHRIMYHVPSHMFNVTQLQQLSTPEQFVTAVSDLSTRCENFIEVRGSPKIEGCYVPLAKLSVFANALDVTIKEAPRIERPFPSLNSSDFSRVPRGRIVLAHTGLVAYASVPRTAAQFTHLPAGPDDIHGAHSFLPTYFGDMEVFPRIQEFGFNNPRPAHWSQYKTSDEMEVTAKYNSKVARAAAAQEAKGTNRNRIAKPAAKAEESDLLLRLYKERKHIRARTTPPPARDVENDLASKGHINSRPKRIIPNKPPVVTRGDKLTASFIARNPNLLSSPPRRGYDPHQRFPIYPASEGLQDDEMQVGRMLEAMSDSDESDKFPGMTNFTHYCKAEHNDDDNDCASTVKASTIAPPRRRRGRLSRRGSIAPGEDAQGLSPPIPQRSRAPSPAESEGSMVIIPRADPVAMISAWYTNQSARVDEDTKTVPDTDAGYSPSRSRKSKRSAGGGSRTALGSEANSLVRAGAGGRTPNPFNGLGTIRETGTKEMDWETETDM